MYDAKLYQFKFKQKVGTVSGTQIKENPLRFTIGLKKLKTKKWCLIRFRLNRIREALNLEAGEIFILLQKFTSKRKNS